MTLNNIPSGIHLPEDVYVIIEVPLNTISVKYEINKDTNILFVDRFISTTMYYPFNYGYVNHTMSLDGDPLDVAVITQYVLYPGSVINCRPIGLLKMFDELGEDNKLIVVPSTKVSKDYDHLIDITDLTVSLKRKIVHFFEHYKDLDSKKWVKVLNWEDIKSAKLEILSSIERAKNLN